MSHFFAMVSRMKYINRWGLMRNTREENLCEHSFETAVIAHALSIIKNKKFGGNIDAGKAAVFALFHDTTEIITGDMPTPVKYFSEEMRNSYKAVEAEAEERLINYLPSDFKEEYSEIIKEADPEIKAIVKAADKISALIKCIEEVKSGNREFAAAMEAQKEIIKNLNLPEVDYYMKEYIPSYSLSLDEQK